MIDLKVVSEMDRKQLIELAGKLDVKFHHKSKDDTIRKQIIEQVASRQMSQKKEGWEESKPVPEKPKFNNTKEEVLEAIGELANQEGFKIEFPEDNTVIFTYRGVSESVNLSIPMHIIVRQAKSAAKVKYGPKMVKDGEVRGVGVMMYG